jgi:hypothetical protein
MPAYVITAPDGKEYEVEGDGTQEEALAYFQSQYEAPSLKPHEDPRSPTYGQAPIDPSLYDQGDIRKQKMLQGVREVARQTGRGLTGLADGVMALPRMAANIPSNVINALGGNVPTFPSLQSSSPEFAPKNNTEVFADKVTGGLGSMMGGMGVGSSMMSGTNQTAQGIGSVLTSRPAVQTASAVTGAAGSEIARQSGGGPIAELIGGLGGAMAPGFIGSAAPMATRAGFRGGEAGRQKVEDNLRMFEKAGTKPTVGQATEGRMMRGAESLLSRTPGGAGQMIKKAEGQADDLGAAIEARAAQLAKKTSGEQAGRTIERGVGDFVSKFRAKQGQLYGDLDTHIAPDTQVPVANTLKALKELTTATKGAEATSAKFINQKIASIAEGMATDAKSGTIPYGAVRELRTRIGQELENTSLVDDVPKAQWKRLWGAMSQDLGDAAKTAGPKAQQSWSRANQYTSAGHARIEAIEHVVGKAGGPEKIFQAAISGNREGATTLRSVMQSLDAEGQKTVSATVLRRLGIANPSNQNDLGEKFSTGTFLTNWNKLSPEAKRTLFDRYGAGFRDDMDEIAKITGNLREGSKVFQNPSGTEQATAQAATVGGFALSVVTGNFGAAAAILAGAGGANLSARLMTNPRFVKWLAQSTKHPLAHAPSMINNLAQQAEGDEDIAYAAAILEQQIQQ